MGLRTTKELEEIYSAEWAKTFKGLEGEMQDICDALDDAFQPDSVIDIGCGPAMQLECWRQKGKRVVGIEGSRHLIAKAPKAVQPFIEHRNIAMGGRLPESDLVVCTEVAEHIGAENANCLVAMISLALAPGGRVFWTAAIPGQGGHDHNNEQPPKYWDAKFAKFRIITDEVATRLVLDDLRRRRAEWRQGWLFNTGRILRRA